MPMLNRVKVNQAKIKYMVNWVNDTLINLGHAVNKKTIHKNENPDKVIDIVGKILDFNKQQKGKCLKILTHKQIL